eukprot:CAMPEP_0174830790 /NCGR_PEP_ID=MMETSP1114-20130205/2727_1 /TAXON_ID=312471 /ORGANISM="Neobodo designis, Strain CCAP 1951/1" /LENGTH=62 /DNA_ID=CAMNT_0016064597 /DNA_START=205 /DNA_END=393 /DNA_ORIENTATION=+
MTSRLASKCTARIVAASTRGIGSAVASLIKPANARGIAHTAQTASRQTLPAWSRCCESLQRA